MNVTCKNHPDTSAKRNCFYCKLPICSKCQLLLGHHYFCSKRCYRKYQFNHLWNGFKKSLNNLLLLPLYLLDKLIELFICLKQLPFRTYTDIILSCCVIISLGLSIILTRKIKHLEIKFESEVYQSRIQESSTPDPKNPSLKLISPANNAMVLSNKVTINGEAEQNTIISLMQDSTLLAVALSKDGLFKFEDVTAKRGQNVFKVNAISPDGKLKTIQQLQFSYHSPTLRYLSRNFVRGDRLQKKITITFDGDYLNNAADPILKILKAKNIKCSFFITGRFLEKYPETVKRLLQEGHEVGNHTWDHPHLTTFEQNKRHDTRPGITRNFLHQQLIKTNQLFREITGSDMTTIWRAPYGEHNAQIRLWAAELGYRQIGWTVGKDWHDSMDTGDWVADKNSTIYLTADQIVEKVLRFGLEKADGANGCIILMHLGTLRNEDFPYSKLPDMIDGLREQGYTMVPVSQIIY